jgi:hypothetical protein
MTFCTFASLVDGHCRQLSIGLQAFQAVSSSLVGHPPPPQQLSFPSFAQPVMTCLGVTKLLGYIQALAKTIDKTLLHTFQHN